MQDCVKNRAKYMGLGSNDFVVNNCKHMILFLTRSGQILIWFGWISSHRRPMYSIGQIRQRQCFCIRNGVIVKGFHIHGIYQYLIDCVGRPWRNMAGVCTSLKRRSSDIISTYFHSQFRRQYSLP